MPAQSQKNKLKRIQLDISESASKRLEQSARRLGISVEEAASALLARLGTPPGTRHSGPGPYSPSPSPYSPGGLENRGASQSS